MPAELQMNAASDGSCTVCSHYNHGNVVARLVSTPLKLIMLGDLCHIHTYEQESLAVPAPVPLTAQSITISQHFTVFSCFIIEL